METIAGLDAALLRGVVEAGPTPLFATLSGAHLYGFASPDSDVDLRGAFVAPLRQVIGLKEPRLTHELSRNQAGLELDWVAHDVVKFARLMTRRNGYVLEQLYSPLVVWGGPWLDELRAIGAGCVVRHLFHHYGGFARNQRELLAKPGVTVKALLYTYRVYLTGVHVLRSGRIEANLSRLLEAQPGLTAAPIPDLIARKQAGAEQAVLGPGELDAHLPALDALEVALAGAFGACSLPEQPTTFAALNDYVVRARLELGRE